MGTLCKNCPFKDAKKDGNSCTELFVAKYHNSCVTYDINETRDLFLADLEEFIQQKKDEEKEKQKKMHVVQPIIIEQVEETPSQVEETVSKVEETPVVVKKPRKTVAKKATTKKAATKKVGKEITEENG